MTIYKIVWVELGERVLEEMIFWDREMAIKYAEECTENPQLDMVSVYEEKEDPAGYFRRAQCVYEWRKERDSAC